MVYKRRVPKLVIFDLDGTIIDTESISYDMWKRVATEYNFTIEDDLIFSFIGRNSESIKKKFIERLGDKLPFDELYAKKKDYCFEVYNQGVNLKEGVVELLDTLDELKVKKAVATSSSRARALMFLEKHGLLDRFDHIVTGDMVQRSKPNPEIFLKCMSELSILPVDSMVIEDSKNGITASQRSGAITVLVPDLLKPDDDMKERSDLIFKNLNELKDYLKEISSESGNDEHLEVVDMG